LKKRKPKVKKCRDCKKVLPIENFSTSLKHRDGYVTQCHACKEENIRLSKVRWRKNNKEKHKEYMKRYLERKKAKEEQI